MAIFKTDQENITSIHYLAIWFMTALISGLTGSVLIHTFIIMVSSTGAFLTGLNLPFFVWPPVGALIVGLIIFRLEPGVKGEGIPSYIEGMQKRGGKLSPRETFFKLWSSFFTLCFLGNGGIAGPIGRVSAGLSSFLGGKIKIQRFKKDITAISTICGLSAALGALLNSPIGAGIFAVEVIQKSSMRYRILFPSILASTFGVIFSRIFGFEPLFNFSSPAGPFHIKTVWLILAAAVFSGYLGKGFIMLYTAISRFFKRDLNHPVLKTTLHMITGSLLAAIPLYYINSRLMGNGFDLFNAVLIEDIPALAGSLSETIPLPAILAILIVAKAYGNCLTVGSGMSAGFAGPALLIGLLSGALISTTFQIDPSDPSYYALLAAGMAGMFSSTMNTPIAAAVITVELFGSFYSIPAALAAVAGFQINRHKALYDFVVHNREERGYSSASQSVQDRE